MHLIKHLAVAIAIFAGLATAQIAEANNQSFPTSVYMTRPMSQAPFLNVTVSESGFSQGYVFIGPWHHPAAGPYIYDKFGNLVWDGFGIIGPTNSHDFKVCQYKGQPHLCATLVDQRDGYGVGQAVIINANYSVVTTIQTGRSMMPADMHEFQLLNDGETALLTSYNTIPYDLSGFNVTSGLGWLMEGAFQEIDVASGAVLFEWYSTNHVDPSATDVTPGTNVVIGDGLTPSTGFDYFHINSIDKSSRTGNYLVSSRHVSTVYYINASDENILWRLSSRGESDFSCNAFNFSFQHDARLRSENNTNTIISIFDNASDGVDSSSSESSGMFINIDHTSGVATLLNQYTPDFYPGGILVDSQGNTQVLPNGNVFNGWGSHAWVSEHTEDGTTVFAAHYADPDAVTAQSYRAYSFEWQSTPANTVPQVYSYAQSDQSDNRIYVSWNGATTVTKWRFYGSQAIGDGFPLIGETMHDGFETEWVAPGFYKWVMVEAMAWDGTSLRNSSYQPTFVPSQAIMSACSADGCSFLTSANSTS